LAACRFFRIASQLLFGYHAHERDFSRKPSVQHFSFIMFFVWAAALLLAIWAARVAQRFGVRIPRMIQRPLASENLPPVAVILPIKGVDDDTASNIEALLQQDYPDYRLVFTVESEQDPVLPVLEKIAAEDSRVEIVVAGLSTQRGQKIHNQLAAVERTTDRDEVLAFMDADAKPGSKWLHALVLPLTYGEHIGATTGYRYYIPVTNHTANKVVSIINASVAALLGPYRRTFAWGGSMAIRRKDFYAFGLPTLWSNALSDDYVMSYCIKKVAKRHIQFVPNCIVASDANFNWASLFEFAVRQYRITKVCEPLIWLTAVCGALIYLSAMAYTLTCSILGFFRPDLVPDHFNQIVMFLGLYAASAIRGYLLVLGGKRLLPEHAKAIQSTLFCATVAFPWVVLINLLALVGSAFGREIVWRGVEYIMQSRTRTIVRRPNLPAAGSGHKSRSVYETIRR